MALAMSVMRYGFGVINWTQSEIRALDQKTRKILTKYKFHHPKSNIHRMYMPRTRGGRGLIGVSDCHRQECTAIAEYIKNSTDPLTAIIKETERNKNNGILSFLNPKKHSNVDEIHDEHEKELKKMNMHGQYFREQKQIPKVNIKLSNKWLDKAHLRFETESLLCAEQEQSIKTNYIQNKVWKNTHSPLCRLCKEKNETVTHVVSGCKMLAANKYTFRHNQVATYVHWNILRDRGIEVTKNWLHHKPITTVTIDDVTIMWDLPIITDKKVMTNRPEIMIHDSKNKSCKIINIAIPACTNVVKKIAEKITKYKELEIELKNAGTYRK